MEPNEPAGGLSHFAALDGEGVGHIQIERLHTVEVVVISRRVSIIHETSVDNERSALYECFRTAYSDLIRDYKIDKIQSSYLRDDDKIRYNSPGAYR